MALYAVQGEFAFRNVARRDGVLGNVRTRFGETGLWGADFAEPFTTQTGDPGLRAELRFHHEADADAFWTNLIAFLGTGVNGPVKGSFVQRHDCLIDETQPHVPQSACLADQCVVSERRDY